MRELWMSLKGRICSLRKGRSGKKQPFFRQFLVHQGGAVVLLFGLTVIPLIGFVGGAVDFANAYRMRSKLQDALDTAALAAGREIEMGSSVADATTAAEKVLAANLGEGIPKYTATFDVDNDAKSVVASADMRVDTYLLGVLGNEFFDVHVNSTVKLPNGKVEVALVLDNSGSMRGSKLRDLKEAAERLTEILFQNTKGKDWVRIGVVPFAASVNVGPKNDKEDWMDTEGRSSIHFENFDAPINRFQLYEKLKDVEWAGCVEVRPEPHDVTDATPTIGDGDTFFVPMFAPDEPDSRRGWDSYNNSYLDDSGGKCRGGPGDDEMVAQERTCKYDGGRPSRWANGPNYMCTTQEILPLTDSKKKVIRALDDMDANGLTNIHEGLMWGWRVLSPGAPFEEGRGYDVDDNTKIMIVMTDGANTHGGRSNKNKSNYSAYGYAKNGRLRSPTTSTSRLVSAMNSKTAQACTNAKAAGIVVYTIAVEVRDRDTIDMLADCATNKSRAFSIDDADALTAVFEAIAGEINKLRISS